MGLKYKKTEKISLKGEGLSEKWLQNRIEDDPSILGLGDLIVIKREKKQKKGRIDFLMENTKTNKLYEIEVQLGSTNASHIIKCIEYWDKEKIRNPSRDHVAVLVAEEVTNRFFNVIYLMNRAIPIIAIQLNVLKLEDDLILDFVKILDLSEKRDDEIDMEVGPSNKLYWNKEDSKDFKISLGLMEKTMKIIQDLKSTELRRNETQSYITLGTDDRNFIWFRPRKSDYVDFEMRFHKNSELKVSTYLDELGITPTYVERPNDYTNIRFHLKEKHLETPGFKKLVEESVDYI